MRIRVSANDAEFVLATLLRMKLGRHDREVRQWWHLLALGLEHRCRRPARHAQRLHVYNPFDPASSGLPTAVLTLGDRQPAKQRHHPQGRSRVRADDSMGGSLDWRIASVPEPGTFALIALRDGQPLGVAVEVLALGVHKIKRSLSWHCSSVRSLVTARTTQRCVI